MAELAASKVLPFSKGETEGIKGDFGMRFFKVMALIGFFCLFTAGSAIGACTVSTTAVDFGNYDVLLGTANDATGTITVACNPTEDISIAIGASPISGSFDPRQMRHTTLPDLLNYNVYTQPGRTQIWGDGSTSASLVSKNNVNAAGSTFSVFGRIPALQNVSGGAYTDTLLVTVYRRNTTTVLATAPLTIRVNVIPSCSVTGTTAVSFGVYDPLNAVDNIAGAGNFTFNCGISTLYQLHIAGVRQMNDGLGNLIDYGLYTDAGRTSVWPSSTPSAETGVTAGAPVTRDVFGRIFAGQDVPIGAYLSTVTVTVTY
ncbi:MAG: spore coat U domain-containing protein [Deltaproteobacteria bacterium]|mgnify:FL=1